MNPSLRLVPPGLAPIGVTYGLARFAYGPFLPAIRDDVALTPTVAGLIGGGSYVGYRLAIIVSAWLTERPAPRATAALAGSVAVLGMAAVALAPSPVTLAAAVLFAGASTGLASPPLAQAVAARVAPDGQGRANTLINSGAGAGVALSGAAYIMLTGVYLVWGMRVFADRPAVGLGLPFPMIALGQASGAPVAGAVIGTTGHPAAFALFAGLAPATTPIRPARSDAPPGEPTIVRADAERR